MYQQRNIFSDIKFNTFYNFHTGAEDRKIYFAGIIVLTILLVISFVIIAYVICQNRRLKSSKANPENKSKERNISTVIEENPYSNNGDGNYVQVEDEQSTYTALNRGAKEENDDHLYTHLKMNNKTRQ